MKPFLLAPLTAALLLAAAACDGDPTGSGPPAQVAVTGGGDQTGTAGTLLDQPVTVTVTDDDGDPVEGVEVRFQVVAGGGSVDPAVDSTDAQGRASAAWRLGALSADSQKVQIDVIRRGAVAVSTVVRATARAGAAASLAVVSGSGQTGRTGARLADSLTARVVDAAGNGVPDVVVTWGVEENGGTVSAPTTTTRADGTARVAWTLGAVQGTVRLQASAPGIPPAEFTAAASHPGITITLTQPTIRAYGDSLPVLATAEASAPVVRMTARVEGREANLSAGQGALDLAGLVEGGKTLLVWAVTSTGDSSAVAQRFTYNRAPRLTVVAPARGTVVRTGAARVDADCSDPSGCARVAIYTSPYGDDTGSGWTLLTEGTTSFHGDVSLAAFDGQRRYLYVQATDGLGGRSVAVLGPFYVEGSATWTEVASGGFQALDADATRLLYVDSADGRAHVRVRALAGGTATGLLEVPAGLDVVKGRLFPGGAVFATRDGIYEWRGAGTTQLANDAYRGRTLEVEGGFAAWYTGTAIRRRDLSAGATVTITGDGDDVAVNGDVAFTAADGQVYRWRAGAAANVSKGFLGAGALTDGTQVIFGTEDGSIYLARGSTPVLLSRLAAGNSPRSAYEVEGGWAGFVKPDAGGINHVFSVAPDGTQRQVSSGAPARIAAMGPAGEMVFVHRDASGARRYLAGPPYTAGPVDVGGEIGEARFDGTTLLVVVGRSVFRVD